MSIGNLFFKEDLFGHDEAAERRDRGMARSEAHAEADEPGWSDAALVALERYLHLRGPEPFLSEQFREWSIRNQVPQPPEPRAWGAVIQKAKRLGLIVSCGTERAATSNLSPKVLWRAR